MSLLGTLVGNSHELLLRRWSAERSNSRQETGFLRLERLFKFVGEDQLIRLLVQVTYVGGEYPVAQV
jgi:hypothetical protein